MRTFTNHADREFTLPYYFRQIVFFIIMFLSTGQFIINDVYAQTPYWQWAHNIPTSGDSHDISNAVVAQPFNGDVYVTGLFKQIIDFDPGENVFNLTSEANSDAFFLKLNASGEFIWAKSFSSEPHTNNNARSLAIDSDGNLVSTGSYTGLTDFDPGEDVNSFYPGTDCSTFLSKLSPDGEFISASVIHGVGCNYGNAIAVYSLTDQMFITGAFDDAPIDFDPGSGTEQLGLEWTAAWKGFVMSVESTGNLSWVREFGGFSTFVFDESFDVIVDHLSGDVYVTGQFHGDCNFEKGSTQHILETNGNSDIFISKYDQEGYLQWARSFGGVSDDTGLSLSIDQDGFVYGTGIFTRSIEIEEFDTIFTSAGDVDIFLFKMDSDGQLVWFRTLGGIGEDTRSSIVVDQVADEIIISGEFTDTVDFDPGIGVHHQASEGMKDIFILGLNTSGEFRWIKTAGGTGNEIKAGIALSNDHLYVAGDFDSPFFWLDKTVLVEYGSAPNGLDNMFIAKLDLNRSVGISETELQSLKVYPNPVESELTIVFDQDLSQTGVVSLVNMQGMTVLSETRDNVNGEVKMDCRNIMPGMYMVQWKNEKEQLTRKIIVQ